MTDLIDASGTTEPPAAPVAGTSLWRDAWRRLRRNRLAMFGLGVVVVMVAACLAGPPIIARATGYTYDYIPSDISLIKVDAAVYRRRTARFSWTHPMGTDNAGPRPARPRAPRRPHLAHGRDHLDARVAPDRHRVRRDGRLPRRARRRGDDADRRRAVRDSVHDGRDRPAGVLRRAVAARPAPAALRRARRRLVADHGAHRPRAGDVAQGPGVHPGRARHGRPAGRDRRCATWCRTRSAR